MTLPFAPQHSCQLTMLFFCANIENQKTPVGAIHELPLRNIYQMTGA